MILGAVILETMGISFILPVTDCDLNFSTKGKGVLSAIGFIGIITSSHLWGFLADTKGRRRIIRPTLMIAFILTLISSFLNNFWSLVIFRYLNGFLWVFWGIKRWQEIGYCNQKWKFMRMFVRHTFSCFIYTKLVFKFSPFPLSLWLLKYKRRQFSCMLFFHTSFFVVWRLSIFFF